MNIAELAKHVMPNLAVIDGFMGMEGSGPVSGDPVRLKVAAASLYPVSLDAIICKVMGFDPLDVGYLYYLDRWGIGVADVNRIRIVGESIESLARKFKPHPNFKNMLRWK